jgi:hypothetical protein
VVMRTILLTYILKKSLWFSFKIGGIISPILLLFETIEQLRKKEAHVFLKVATKYPVIAFELYPYVFFMSCIFVYDYMKKNNELMALSSLSISSTRLFFSHVWYGIVSFLIYIFIHIVCCISQSYHQSHSAMRIHDNKIWLQDHQKNSYFLISSKKFTDLEYSFHACRFHHFTPTGYLLSSIDCEKAYLRSNHWILIQGEKNGVKFDYLKLASGLTPKKLIDKQPQYRFFWKIPNDVKNLKNTGLPYHQNQFFFHKIIVMIVIFLIFLKISRQIVESIHSYHLMLILSVALCMVVHFLFQMTKALVIAEKINILWGAYMLPLSLCLSFYKRKKIT